MVANAMRDLAHDSIHNITQKQADSREISGCRPSYSGILGGGESMLQTRRPPSVRVMVTRYWLARDDSPG